MPVNESVKMPVSEGRRILIEAHFTSGDDAPAGAAGELWFNRFKYPVFIAYYSGDTQNFSTRSLNMALDERMTKP